MQESESQMIFIEQQYGDLIHRLTQEGSPLAMEAVAAIAAQRVDKAQTIRDALLHEAITQQTTADVEERGHQVRQIVHGMRAAVEGLIRESDDDRLIPMLHAMQQLCAVIDGAFPKPVR